MEDFQSTLGELDITCQARSQLGKIILDFGLTTLRAPALRVAVRNAISADIFKCF